VFAGAFKYQCRLCEISRGHECVRGLKGPKLEIFGSRVFPQRWNLELGTRRKNSKF
jgi:hypothetical protein